MTEIDVNQKLASTEIWKKEKINKYYNELAQQNFDESSRGTRAVDFAVDIIESILERFCVDT